MKNLVLAFSLSLVATGAFAATQIDRITVPTTTSAKMIPMPLCPPDDPAGCHMGSAGQ